MWPGWGLGNKRAKAPGLEENSSLKVLSRTLLLNCSFLQFDFQGILAFPTHRLVTNPDAVYLVG
jgi:hypothetical protein